MTDLVSTKEAAKGGLSVGSGLAIAGIMMSGVALTVFFVLLMFTSVLGTDPQALDDVMQASDTSTIVALILGAVLVGPLAGASYASWWIAKNR